MTLIEYPDCGEPVSAKEKMPARWEHSREGGASSGEAGGKDAYRITKDESDTTVFFHSGSMDSVYLECSKCGRIHKFKKEYFDDIDASGCTSPMKIECPTCKAKARCQTKKGMAKGISAHAGNAGTAKLTRTGILIALAGMAIASLVPPLGSPLLLAGVAIICVERFDKSRIAREEIGAPETLDAGGSHTAATPGAGSGSAIERKKITVPSKEQSARRIASLLSAKVEKCSLEFTAAGYPEVLLNALTLGDFEVYGVPGNLVEITSEPEIGAPETLDAGGSHTAATPGAGSGSAIERKKITVPSKEQSARRIASLLSAKVEKCSLEFTAAGYPEVLLNALTLGDFEVYGVPGDLVEITSEPEHGGKALVCRAFRYNVLGWSAVSHGRKLEGRWDPFHKIDRSEMMFAEMLLVRDGMTNFYFHSEKDARCFKRFHKLRCEIVDKMTRAATDECARISVTRHREMETAVNNYTSILPSALFTDPDYYNDLLCGFCLSDALIWSQLPLNPYPAQEALEQPAYIQAMDLFGALTGIAESKLEIDHRLAPMTAFLLIRKRLIEFYSGKWLEIVGAADGGPISLNPDGYISSAVDKGYVRSDDCDTMACLTYYLIGSETRLPSGYREAFYKVQEAVASAEKERYNRQLTASLLSEVAVGQENRHVDIEDVDEMSGDEFEQAVCRLFCKMGYSAYVTKQSGDQGVDVVAERGSVRIGIQAKRYGYPVGNSAVQETIAGRAFYGCTSSMVITNSTFTKSAIELARVNSVVLWDRAALQKKLMEYPITD